VPISRILLRALNPGSEGQEAVHFPGDDSTSRIGSLDRGVINLRDITERWCEPPCLAMSIKTGTVRAAGNPALALGSIPFNDPMNINATARVG
jgi:hypothetical protein